MYIYIYIKFDNKIYSYTIIYSYTVNVNLMLICIESVTYPEGFFVPLYPHGCPNSGTKKMKCT